MLRLWLVPLLIVGLAACGGKITPPYGYGNGDGGGIIDAPADDDGGGSRDGAVVKNDANCGLRTCASAGANCGPIGDGCGGTLQCGDCTAPETCGGGGPSVCGGTGGCVARMCTDVGATCGPVGDGCGNLLQCGDCTAPETCGGGGTFFVCGQNPPGCQPKSCADYGFTCGAAGDGCGNLIPGGCGTCQAPDICGGGGVPGSCGGGTPDGGVDCTNLCLQQVDCGAGATTSVSGTVRAPNGKEPLYGALVYVPNGTVAAFAPGVACLRCEDEVSGSPLVSTRTDYKGEFKLDDMPAGTNIPLVIQLGRWRRVITIPNVPQCVNTALTTDQTRLPKRQQEGSPLDNIPLTAMVTGDVDQLECVLRKIGIDADQFTLPSGSGRIKMYYENGVQHISNGGAALPDANTLWDTQGHLDQYDMVVFACEGGPYAKGSNEKGFVRAYADKGGRVFNTHYSYTWLFDNDPWGCGDGCTTLGHTVGAWHPEAGTGNSTTGTVDTSFPKGQAFSQWLDVVGASTAPGSNQITINQWRHDLDSVFSPPAQRWVYTSSMVLHATYNTPVDKPADEQCGRVLFSDFHVQNGSLDGDYLFQDCNQTANLTGQEKVLEFMLFDLASCITPDVPPLPTCTRRTCADLGANCGWISDGCDDALYCGDCTLPETCGGCGVPNVCCAPTCVPLTCAQLGLQCGPAGDGCGNITDCGPCDPPDTCGGGGVPGVCGHTTCVPLTCDEVGAECGVIGDGCGDVTDCGPCDPPETCGGGGVPNICGLIT
jgi:hypothetical protein